MANIVKGKKQLCSTSLMDWNPERVNNIWFYERYQDFVKLFSAKLPEISFEQFFAQPVLNDETKNIEWFYIPTESSPISLKEKPSEAASLEKKRIIDRIQQVANTCSENDKKYFDILLLTLLSDKSDELTFVHDDIITFGIWGMSVKKGKVISEVIIDDIADHRVHPITYNVRGKGSLAFTKLHRQHGHILGGDQDVPSALPQEGYCFSQWEPESPFGVKVIKALEFTAVFSKDPNYVPPVSKESKVPPVPPVLPPEPPSTQKFKVIFSAGEHGTLVGDEVMEVEKGHLLPTNLVPSVKEKKGYQFAKWDSPLNIPIENNMTINAVYKKKCRVWDWILNLDWKKLLKMLLFLLLLLFLIGLIVFLFRSCSPKPTPPVPPFPISDTDSTFVFRILPDPIDTTHAPLPIDPNRPVPVDPGDTTTDPISGRKIVADRLNILIDSETLSVEEVAEDFKNLFPQEGYEVIYADRFTKHLQVKVPSSERERLCNTMEQEFIQKFADRYHPGNLFVFDEAQFSTRAYIPNDPGIDYCWYLDAIHAKEAWEFSRGSDSIIIAIVDNGFNLRHEEFRGRVCRAYNVLTHDDDVVEDASSPHGTHVAGTALANADNGKGISGIAPKCRFMPVKVADEYGNLYTTSLVDGILYAAYAGAHVINMSIGTSFGRVPSIPEQQEWARSKFIAEQRLWDKVFEITSKANIVVVLAAGNDNMLTHVDPLHRSSNTLIVSAVNKQHDPLYHKAEFSNFGSQTSISAPGVDIISSVHRNEYQSMNGTSMAAPIVAGAVGLLKSVNPNLTPIQIRDILQTTGEPTQGNIAKLLQLDKALQKAGAIAIDTMPPSLHSGDIELTLRWEGYNDLDLACQEPSGFLISYINRESETLGKLEVDMNAGGLKSATPVEHIYWPDDKAPHGKYVVRVDFYSNAANTPLKTPYLLTIIKYKQDTTYYVGELSNAKEKHYVSFNL